VTFSDKSALESRFRYAGIASPSIRTIPLITKDYDYHVSINPSEAGVNHFYLAAGDSSKSFLLIITKKYSAPIVDLYSLFSEEKDLSQWTVFKSLYGCP
jgi:hypothetical protein